MMDKQAWSEILKEVEELCERHQDGLADFTKCREFGRRLSLLLDRLEGLKHYALADRVMDVMAGCSPKEGSHCDKARETGARLERLRERVRQGMKDEPYSSR
jgi:hypothetical protein